MAHLSVNIDHALTVRQARYRGGASGGEYGEPDALRVAHEAELGGADGITVHLREDRRHVTDRDVEALRPFIKVKFNLEMAATDEMVGIAARVRPHTSMLVPEGRQEVTTEGGLDVVGNRERVRDAVRRLHEAGVLVSCFIDAEPAQIEACAELGVDVCEVHTGPYARAWAEAGGDFRYAALRRELDKVADAGRRIRAAKMRFNAGHALNYHNVGPIAALPGVEELHIGHAIISRAIYVGLREATREMQATIGRGTREG